MFRTHFSLGSGKFVGRVGHKMGPYSWSGVIQVSGKPQHIVHPHEMLMLCCYCEDVGLKRVQKTTL